MSENAKPGSLKNIAFDTGRLWERLDIIDFIQNEWVEYPDVDWLLEQLLKRK